MKTQRNLATLVVAFAMMIGTSTFAQTKEKTVQVGGAPMYPSKNIVQNAVNSKDHTTLVAAVKAAGLVETLQGKGPGPSRAGGVRSFTDHGNGGEFGARSAHLGHFHACGSDRGTPGGDHIAWPEIVKALKAIGYKGDVVIESFTTDVKVIARAAAIWRKIEPKRDNIAVNGIAFLRKVLK